MPPQQQNDYDFIINPQQQKGSGPAFLQNPKQKNIVLAIFILGVFLLIIIGWSVISSIGKVNNDDLLKMTAIQTEIVRVSDLGLDSSTDINTRSQVATLRAFTNTDLVSTTSYLSLNGEEVSDFQLASQRNTETDTALDNALQSGSFDEELISQLDDLMSTYATEIRPAIQSVEGPNKQLLLETIAANYSTYYGDAE